MRQEGSHLLLQVEFLDLSEKRSDRRRFLLAFMLWLSVIAKMQNINYAFLLSRPVWGAWIEI